MMGRQCVSDLRTIMGNNLGNIGKECGFQRKHETPPTPTIVKKTMQYFKTPASEKWRVDILSELLSRELDVVGFEQDEILEMMTFLCST